MRPGNTYTPRNWVVLEITYDGETIRKVFGGWLGGFSTGDSWKLSSGITSVEEFDDYFEFTNVSGSIYVCYKDKQQMSLYQATLLTGWQEALRDSEKTPISIVEF